MDTSSSSPALYEPVKPSFTQSHVIDLCRKLYRINPIDIVQLVGYDDQNFWIKKANIVGTDKSVSQDGYVLKITNSKESNDTTLIDGQVKVLVHLDRHNITAPVPVLNVHGNYYSFEKIEGENKIRTKHAIRLLRFCKGDILMNHKIDKSLAFDLGSSLLKLNNCLKTFKHAAFIDRDLLFMLEKTPSIKQFLHVIKDETRKAMVSQSVERFEQDVLNQMETLEKGLIHGDYNEQNIVIQNNKVSAILDFGDAHYAPYIFEIAIGLAYLLMLTSDFELGKQFLKGYTSERPLRKSEENILTTCVRARICQSLVLGLYVYSQNPENEYVLSSQKTGWEILRILCDKGDNALSIANQSSSPTSS